MRTLGALIEQHLARLEVHRMPETIMTLDLDRPRLRVVVVLVIHVHDRGNDVRVHSVRMEAERRPATIGPHAIGRYRLEAGLDVGHPLF